MTRPNVNTAVGGHKKPTNYTYRTTILKNNIGFKEQVEGDSPNCKYVIKWNYDLEGESVLIPENCILEFDGGTLSNGTITGQDTFIINQSEVEVFDNVEMTGSWKRFDSKVQDPHEYFKEEELVAGYISTTTGKLIPSSSYSSTKRFYDSSNIDAITVYPTAQAYTIFWYDEAYRFIGSTEYIGYGTVKKYDGAVYCRMTVYKPIAEVAGIFKTNLLSQSYVDFFGCGVDETAISDIYDGSITINPATLQSCGGAISTGQSNYGVWLETENYQAAVIPLKQGDRKFTHVKLTANNNVNTLFAFLTGSPIFNAPARFSRSYTVDNARVMTLTSKATSVETVPSDAAYLYVYLRNPQYEFTPASITLLNRNAAVDALKGKVSAVKADLDSIGQTGTKIRICSWNVGHFNGAGSIYPQYNEAAYQTIRTKIRDMLYTDAGTKIRAHVVSVNEYSDNVVTTDGYTHDARTDLFQYYENAIIGDTKRYTKNALFSNIRVTEVNKDIQIQPFNNYSRNNGLTYYEDAYLMESVIWFDNGRRITLVTAHPNGTDAQLNFILNKYGSYNNIVIIGDFNNEDLSRFTSAGFTVMNTSEVTYPEGDLILDNVVYKVGSNFTIDNFQVYDIGYTGDPDADLVNMPSDHCPISIDIKTNTPSTFRPVGATYFDPTLGKPLWWNGTAFVDATGNVPST